MSQTVEKPPSEETVKRGYELPDVSNKGMIIFFALFVLLGVVVHLVVWGLTEYFIRQPRDVDTVISAAPAQQRFPPPNLQPIERHNQLPYQDLADLRREEGQVFEQLGWKMDPETRTPHIPDDVVNQLARERGAK